MLSKTQEYMKFIPKQNQKNGKDRIHSLSPNVRPQTSTNNQSNNKMNNKNIISNNLNKNNNMINNKKLNSNRLRNYNIKVNFSKDLQKEKIIEGDLNFNLNIKSISKQNNNLSKKNKGKNNYRMPRKSPVPINTNNIRKKNIFFNPLLNEPKNSFRNNIISNNKPLSSLNKNIKNKNRNNSPLLRTNEKNKIMTINKNAVKPKVISKSPVLGKNAIYNRFTNFGFNKKNNNNNLIKPQVFMKGKINYPQNSNNINIFNNLNNFTNNQLQQINKVNYVSGSNINSNIRQIQQKKAIITCEFEEENKKELKNNHDTNMSPNKNNKDIKLNNNGSNSNALVNNEIKTNTETKNPSQNKKLDNNNQKNLVRKNKNIPIIQNIRLNKNGYEEILNKNNQEESVEILEINEKINSKNEKHPKQKKDQDQSKEKISIHKKIKDLNVFTHVGFDGEQEKANNQDNYFIKKNFAGHKDYIFMSVCDGHGLNGHHVSNFIKTILPIDMSENLKHCNILTETEKIHEIIKETFIIANDKLVENQEIDCIFSGTTCVSVIFTPEKLICPNIGDSRAVLARYNKNEKKYIAIDLTRDHKPTELDEKQRIIENDGKIQPFIEDGEFVGPERIWIKEEDIPGLAMTRSFGDRVAATVGVISEPEIKEFYLDENDKFMIIASDGIWEFISSQECVDITSSYYEKNDIKGCCQYLYAESSKRWLKEEEVIDDTTLILVFFE